MTYNPWVLGVALNGTDGLQFAPEMDEDDVGSVSVFSSDLSRNLNFIFTSEEET